AARVRRVALHAADAGLVAAPPLRQTDPVDWQRGRAPVAQQVVHGAGGAAPVDEPALAQPTERGGGQAVGARGVGEPALVEVAELAAAARGEPEDVRQRVQYRALRRSQALGARARAAGVARNEPDPGRRRAGCGAHDVELE